jgi:argininosuccinate lyase
MADLLWQKPGVAVDARIQAFLAGDDVLLDREFFLHDITASAAHAEGLQRIGILTAEELDGLKRELRCWPTISAVASSSWTSASRMAIPRSRRG